MPLNFFLKLLWEGILIGIVTAMIMVAFFMPYYSIHYQISKDIHDVLVAFNPLEKTMKELTLPDHERRLILVEDIRELSGTIFSPTLLFGNSNFQDNNMFFSSFDFFMQGGAQKGETIEVLGIRGLYGGFYPSEHPYGDNFLVIISPRVNELTSLGMIQNWTMAEGYRIHPLPRNFRGVKLLYFILFSGLLYFVYGIVGILVDNPLNFVKENILRLVIVSLTIVIALTIYGIFINPCHGKTIVWSCGIAVISNLAMLPPLFLVCLGKKIYKKV